MTARVPFGVRFELECGLSAAELGGLEDALGTERSSRGAAPLEQEGPLLRRTWRRRSELLERSVERRQVDRMSRTPGLQPRDELSESLGAEVGAARCHVQRSRELAVEAEPGKQRIK